MCYHIKNIAVVLRTAIRVVATAVTFDGK